MAKLLIPRLDQYGYLPEGIHTCSVEELVERFGQGSPEREVEAIELVRFLDWIAGRDVLRIIVDGSFVTDRVVPLDLDLVILPVAEAFERLEGALAWEGPWPFLHIIIAVDTEDLIAWVSDFLGKDRRGRPKAVRKLVR